MKFANGRLQNRKERYNNFVKDSQKDNFALSNCCLKDARRQFYKTFLFPYFHKYGKIIHFYRNMENDRLNLLYFFSCNYRRFSHIFVIFSHIYKKNSGISIKTGKSPVLRKYGITKLREYKSFIKLTPDWLEINLTSWPKKS